MPTEHSILQNAAFIIDAEIKKIFAEQGHSLTGAWEDSVSSTSTAPNEIEGWAKTYGAILNEGVTPGKIPFNGAGSGGTSKYIQGLVNFWKLRKPGITEKQALQLAFATANAQKKEGMSTVASRVFSTWGDRQHYINIAFIEKDEEIADMVGIGLSQVVNEVLNEPQTINY